MMRLIDQWDYIFANIKISEHGKYYKEIISLHVIDNLLSPDFLIVQLFVTPLSCVFMFKSRHLLFWLAAIVIIQYETRATKKFIQRLVT